MKGFIGAAISTQIRAFAMASRSVAGNKNALLGLIQFRVLMQIWEHADLNVLVPAPT